jgi:hypothetical protein
MNFSGNESRIAAIFSVEQEMPDTRSGYIADNPWLPANQLSLSKSESGKDGGVIFSFLAQNGKFLTTVFIGSKGSGEVLLT